MCAHEAGKEMQETHSCCAALTGRSTSLVAVLVSHLFYLQHLRAGVLAGGAGGRMGVLGEVWKRQSDEAAGGRDGTGQKLGSEQLLCLCGVCVYIRIHICVHASVCLSELLAAVMSRGKVGEEELGV